MIDGFKLLYDLGDISVWNSLATNSNLTEEQIDLLYQTEGLNKYYLAQYPKLTEEQFMRFFNDGEMDKNSLARNSNFLYFCKCALRLP